MLVRAIVLSLALLIGVGAFIPMITDTIEAGPKYKKKKKKKLKKYSKAWWRWYKKEQRKKRALMARKRALRAKQILLARQRANKPKKQTTAKSFDKRGQVREKTDTVADLVSKEATLPTGKKAPKNFKQSQVSNSEQQFNVNDDSGNQLGKASITVFGPAMGEDADSGRTKLVGGVPTGSLRRGVIDKMMREDGWVVNDYHKEINGKKVYVVVAQSSVRGVVQSRLFYFTEVDGKIYTLSTTAPNESEQQLARESEKMIQSLQRGNRPTQAGLK